LITESGKIIAKTSVEHVTCDDYLQTDKKSKIDEFNRRLEESLDDANFVIEGKGEFESMYLDDIEADENPGVAYANDANTPSTKDYDNMPMVKWPNEDDKEAIDNYLNVELIINMGTNDEWHGRVVKRSWGLDGGEQIGHAHNNPLFDTREYEVEFTDGTHEKYQANVIAENMYAQVDDEGNEFLLLKEITDHRSDGSAIQIVDGTVRSANGMEKPKKTTRGWFLLVQWKDGSVSWEKLSYLKASNPVEVAEYAVANHLVEEPAFKWWVPHVIKWRNRIISKVKWCYWKTTH
jgi:hypothetical protein